VSTFTEFQNAIDAGAVLIDVVADLDFTSEIAIGGDVKVTSSMNATLDGGKSTRLFNVSGSLTIIGMTLANGYVRAKILLSGQGGGRRGGHGRERRTIRGPLLFFSPYIWYSSLILSCLQSRDDRSLLDDRWSLRGRDDRCLSGGSRTRGRDMSQAEVSDTFNGEL